MDTGRLASVLEAVESDFAGGQIESTTGLIQALVTARDNPGQDHTATIQAARDKLREALQNSPTNQLPPSKVRILLQIGATEFVGAGALKSIDRIFAEKAMSIAGMVVAMEAYSAQVTSFRTAISQVRKGFDALDIEVPTLGDGEFEVGILVPDTLTDGKLTGLNKQMEIWNNVVRGFAELAGGEHPEVSVRGVASGSVAVFLLVGITTAKYLSRTIDKLLEWYTKIQQIRETRIRLEELGVTTDDPQRAKDHEREILRSGIDGLVSEMISQSPAKLPADRKKELHNHLTIHIQHVARFVDYGGDVEVSAPPASVVPPAPEPPTGTEGESEGLKRELKEVNSQIALREARLRELASIAHDGASLARLPIRSQPILQIGSSGDESGPDDGTGKASKKR